MGGVNPYIRQPQATTPTNRYKITFLPMNVTVEVDPEKLPCGDHGLPGSILDIALSSGVGLDHACGGVCACATCHVVVKEGFHTLREPTEEELDQLDKAPNLKPTSRLGCQAVPSGQVDIVVEVPEWNRNLVQVGH